MVAAPIGKATVQLNSPLPGRTTISIPIKPRTTIDHLLFDTFSLSRIAASIVEINGANIASDVVTGSGR
ncbi:hypothetical protein PPGU19_100110 (plasmid) [Paraburkholderia sp. PGU19]|nr:hypothetical protein PPGU19_100110 [Paraburkholderia sp. PGU19]